MQVKNFKTKCKKMLYIALGIFIIFFVYLASGCSIYYPTSYRAFIPKQWDSEYKEYERLCKENIGKVVYARPITQEEFEKMKALYAEIGYYFFSYRYVPVSKSLYEYRMSLHKDFRTYPEHESSRIVYQMVLGYAYDRYWTEFIFFTKGSPTSEKFLECEIKTPKEDLFLTMAFKEQRNIGTKNDVRLGEHARIEFARKDNNVR